MAGHTSITRVEYDPNNPPRREWPLIDPRRLFICSTGSPGSGRPDAVMIAIDQGDVVGPPDKSPEKAAVIQFRCAAHLDAFVQELMNTRVSVWGTD